MKPVSPTDTVHIVNPKDPDDTEPLIANHADAIKNGWTLWENREQSGATDAPEVNDDDTSDELSVLRTEYAELAGKDPDGRWGADRVRQEIDRLSDNSPED